MKFFLRACCFAGITGTALFLTWNTVLLPAKQQRQEAVLQVLNTLSAEFLVLETEKVMADIRVHTGNLLLGPRSGTARVFLNIHRGFDVDRLLYVVSKFGINRGHFLRDRFSPFIS